MARNAGKVDHNTLKFVHRARAERDYLLSGLIPAKGIEILWASRACA